MQGTTSAYAAPRPMGVVAICGVHVYVHRPETAVADLIERARSRTSTVVHLCNAHVLSLTADDPDYAALFHDEDLNLADGLPVAWFSRWAGIHDAARVSGPDLFADVIRQSAAVGVSHFLFGGSADTLAALQTSIRSLAPDADIRGAISPPFRDPTDDELDDLAHTARATGAHILWIGLGTPKQDQVIDRMRTRLDGVVMVSIGAAFDFLGGAKQRAPLAMQRLGLEWLHRLISEPGRLGKRYVIGNTKFLLAASRSHRLVSRLEATEVTSETPRRRSAAAGSRRRLVVADTLVIAMASLLAYLIRSRLGESGVVGQFQNEFPVAAGLLPLWLAILYSFGCYRPQFQNQSSEAFRRFLGATTVAGLVLGFLSFALRLDLSRIYVLSVYVLALVLGSIARAVLRARLRIRRAAGELTQRVVVVGLNADARNVAAAMRGYTVAGYDVVGYVADTDEVPDDLVAPVLGRTSDLVRIAKELEVDLVVISPSALDAGDLQRYSVELEDTGVSIAVAPSLFEVVTRRVTVESVANVPILHIDRIRLEGWKALAKRLEDLVVTLALAVFIVPIAVVAALAIKLDDRGPVFFAQARVGKNGDVFRIYKFRTMVIDAEERLEGLAELNEAGQHFFKIREDPRVTRVGRFLRKWSIDEVPQFWNVIRGDMALVGPRPPIPAEVTKYEPWHRRRLRVKPGITGVWQVSGRSDVPFDEAVRLDLFYIENWSLGYDVFLLSKTAFAVLGRNGAY